MLPAYHHAIVALRKAASVVVCAHVKPDGDAMGSVLALTLALRDAGIPAVPTLADDQAAPATYAFLPGFGLFVPASALEAPDVFVALDTPDPSRLGVAQTLCASAGTVVVIDHHPDAKPYGAIDVLDSTAAASAELVWGLVRELGTPPSADVALCCYTGLATDTGRFAYDNTTAETFRVAAELVDAGVDPSSTARLLYQDRSAAALALEARVLARLALANHGHVAHSFVTGADFTETGARREEGELLPDAIRALGGVDVALLVGERDGELRVNLRAKTGFDVGTVARTFGGGGHRAASGFTWPDTDRVALLARLLPLLPGA